MISEVVIPRERILIILVLILRILAMCTSEKSSKTTAFRKIIIHLFHCFRLRRLILIIVRDISRTLGGDAN